MSTTPTTKPPLRTGWTTGACAAAAAKAALAALLSGHLADTVAIRLPRGQEPRFDLAEGRIGEGWAEAGIIKDAGDDPDVTHGALIRVRVEIAPQGAGLVFRAGPGVGTVTRPGLPLAPGEPAINPAPRAMIAEALQSLDGAPADLVITVAIPGGEELAKRTMNGRLGIIGGLSVLGTTGIVRPYSCAAWIASIHRGIDVARAAGLDHLAACTGSTSEKAVTDHFHLPESALIDMGDFAGGTLKYLRGHPVARLTLAGGLGKLAKLAQGHLDLHSARSKVDPGWLAIRCAEAGADDACQSRLRIANSALDAHEIAAGNGIDLAAIIAREARHRALEVAGGGVTSLDVLVVARDGAILAEAEASAS